MATGLEDTDAKLDQRIAKEIDGLVEAGEEIEPQHEGYRIPRGGLCHGTSK